MRILITNDDGITAPGFALLEKIAASIAGPDGEIWSVAPDTEQSGTAHCISFVHPVLFRKERQRRFAINGTPADCVLVGLHHLMKDRPPDLVLTGVNRGNNAGENIVYSGTVGAAMEAALQGIRAVALSQWLGPDNRSLDNPFEAAGAAAEEVLRSLLNCRPWQEGDHDVFFNVNFPPVPADRLAGIKFARQGRRQRAGFQIRHQRSDSGRHFAWIVGGEQTATAEPQTDVDENLRGFTTITPLRADLTDYRLLEIMNGTRQ